MRGAANRTRRKRRANAVLRPERRRITAPESPEIGASPHGRRFLPLRDNLRTVLIAPHSSIGPPV